VKKHVANRKTATRFGGDSMKGILSWITSAKHWASICSSGTVALRYSVALLKRCSAQITEENRTEGSTGMVSTIKATALSISRLDLKRLLDFLENARFFGNASLCLFLALNFGEEEIVVSYIHESGKTTTLVFGARDTNGKRGFTYTTNFASRPKDFTRDAKTPSGKEETVS
jgi:hypothetical protein